MSDLFYPEVPVEFIKKVFFVMNDTPQHTYQVLTKRADRLLEIHHQITWTGNIWMRVSVEDEQVTKRIDFLRITNAKTKFLSCEPLPGPLNNMNLAGIDWVIVDGESGRKARSMKDAWVWDVKLQCQEQETLFFLNNGAEKIRRRQAVSWLAQLIMKCLCDNIKIISHYLFAFCIIQFPG